MFFSLRKKKSLTVEKSDLITKLSSCLSFLSCQVGIAAFLWHWVFVISQNILSQRIDNKLDIRLSWGPAIPSVGIYLRENMSTQRLTHKCHRVILSSQKRECSCNKMLFKFNKEQTTDTCNMNLKNIMPGEKSRHKRLQIVLFHLYEILLERKVGGKTMWQKANQ